MSKQHHFVVSFDESTGKWTWDTDAEEARFEDGTIYNQDTNEWSSGYLGNGEYEPAEDNLVEQLKHALWCINLVNGKADDSDE
jgi:hypothetical protein